LPPKTGRENGLNLSTHAATPIKFTKAVSAVKKSDLRHSALHSPSSAGEAAIIFNPGRKSWETQDVSPGISKITKTASSWIDH